MTDAVAAELHQVRLHAQAHRFLSRVVECGATMQRQSRDMRVIRRLDSGAYDGQDFLRDAQELGHRLRLLDEYGGYRATSFLPGLLRRSCCPEGTYNVA